MNKLQPFPNDFTFYGFILRETAEKSLRIPLQRQPDADFDRLHRADKRALNGEAGAVRGIDPADAKFAQRTDGLIQ